MNFPFGLRMAEEAFWKSGWVKKKMTCAYVQGNFYAVGFNDARTHPLALKYKHRHCNTHAEVAVLNRLQGELPGTLYVYRATKAGKPGMARPCAACMEYIRDRGITRIVYTTEQGFAKERLNA